MNWSRGGTAGRILMVVLLLAAAWFLYHTAATNWSELREFRWRVRGGVLALSIVAHVAVLAFGVFLWSRVLTHFVHHETGFRALLRIWSLANAARYIPGGIWQFVAAAQLSRGAGLPGVLALTSMLVHVMLSLLAAVTISVLVLPLEIPELGVLATLPARAALLVLAVAVVHPAVINGGLGLVRRVLRREVLAWHGRWRHGIALLLLANLSWLLYGAAYTLFVASLASVPLGSVVPFTAVNALSFAAGLLAVPVPGGVGVRESAMTLLLTPYLPAGVAAIIAVAARLWSIAAELLLVALGLLLRPTGAVPLPPDPNRVAGQG